MIAWSVAKMKRFEAASPARRAYASSGQTVFMKELEMESPRCHLISVTLGRPHTLRV